MIPTYEANYIKSEIIEQLLNDVPWLDLTPARKECFMSDWPATYRYGSGVSAERVYNSVPFHKDIRQIMKIINVEKDLNFNVCFLNRYDNQQNHLGWHADDSPEIDINHPIAVVSFGALREIWWKQKDIRGVVPESNRQMLEPGSLFIMPSGFQKNHLHKIPKCDKTVDVRVSLTFRRYIGALK